jgi:hypothetical protein
MKAKNMFLKCPKCGAEQDLTGSDIGRLEMMPLPLHVKTLCMEKSLSGESHNCGRRRENVVKAAI